MYSSYRRTLLRVKVAILALLTLGAAPGQIQNYDYSPTHIIECVTNTTPRRGGSAASFTRATVSSQYSQTALADLASGAAAISVPLTKTSGTPDYYQFDSTGAAGCHVGPATTYVAQQNQTIDNAYWVDMAGEAIVVADDAVAPDGTTTAEKIQDDNGVAEEGRRRSFTTSADTTTWTATVWVKCVAGNGAYPAINLNFTDDAGAGAKGSVNATCDTNWRKITASVTNDGAGTNLQLDLIPSNGGANQGSAHFWRPELYNRVGFTEVDVVTVGASVVKNADALSYTSFTFTEVGSMCFWVWPSDDTQALVLTDWVVAGADVRFQMTTSRTLQLGITDGANNAQALTTTALTLETWSHVCTTWDQDNSQIEIYVNGAVAAQSGTWDEAWTNALTYDTVLEFVGGDEAFFSRFKYWNSRVLSAGRINAIYRRELGAGYN